ncbi:probable 2-oxoglutarate-dependent dioxygenase DIN11 isoform X2 [Lingula anatina]|nr:probable 2-oxoglutarate-dependent dioxygenase DIN11 isoform X2 [Lingula anatina]|eukprot:XP_013412115.1 probable 2-oxoglutarate-dependent dioxygenase DIN11 isoform X2 [Lingula anatina]
MRKGEYHGFAATETERLNPDRPQDFKETMNYLPGCPIKDWPVTEVPQFVKDYQNFFDTCSHLGHRVLQSIAAGLGLQDIKSFQKFHQFLGQPGNLTALRTLHYPPVKVNELKEGQLRLGEHSDYGSITLLFQDDVGGLEVEGINGEWIPATPIPGTIIVNVGDMLMRMTAGKLKSNRHKVVVPEEEVRRKVPRFSAAFFMMTDQEAVISPLDGSTSYAPLTMGEYINKKFAETY